mmetsp:Transcript_1937/g.4320  ORF Transcript_1937/g.4320 Transcript_1937/m.4320 type:complete len:215 (+) Transcript_1937:1181-1825(+)
MRLSAPRLAVNEARGVVAVDEIRDQGRGRGVVRPSLRVEARPVLDVIELKLAKALRRVDQDGAGVLAVDEVHARAGSRRRRSVLFLLVRAVLVGGLAGEPVPLLAQHLQGFPPGGQAPVGADQGEALVEGKGDPATAFAPGRNAAAVTAGPIQAEGLEPRADANVEPFPLAFRSAPAFLPLLLFGPLRLPEISELPLLLEHTPPTSVASRRRKA